MDGFEGQDSLRGTTNHHLGLQKPTGAAVFDASQYEFFGGDAVEVELGGLEEDDFNPVGFEDEDFQLERKELNNVVRMGIEARSPQLLR